MLSLLPTTNLILLLLFCLLKERGVSLVVLAIFVYASLHASYGIFEAAVSDNASIRIVELHQKSLISVAILGGSFLLISCVLIMYRMKGFADRLISHHLIILASSMVAIIYLIFMIFGMMRPEISREFGTGISCMDAHFSSSGI